MAKIRREGKKEVPAISTASLPDIIFMLLFFFMATTSMKEVTYKVDIHAPEAVGPPDVHHDEAQAHHQGADGQHLAQDGDLLDGLPVVDVGGDDQHDGGGGHAHQEGEVADVEAPRDLVAHPGDDEPLVQLADVGPGSDGDEEQQEAHPGVVVPAAMGDDLDGVGDESLEVPQHGLTPRRSRRSWVGCSVLP